MFPGPGEANYNVDSNSDELNLAHEKQQTQAIDSRTFTKY